MARLLIRGGRLLDPSRDLDESSDVLIEDGLVAAVGPELEARGAEVQSLLLDNKGDEKGKAAIDRTVTIQFFAQVGNGMPWEFRPTERQLRVRPGESYTTRFYVRNRANQAVTGQAVPSVSPGVAALHLHKTECFCFTQQRLEAGAEMEMPVTFIVDNELPEEIQTFSLSYTLYRADEEEAVGKNLDFKSAQRASLSFPKIGADG